MSLAGSVLPLAGSVLATGYSGLGSAYPYDSRSVGGYSSGAYPYGYTTSSYPYTSGAYAGSYPYTNGAYPYPGTPAPQLDDDWPYNDAYTSGSYAIGDKPISAVSAYTRGYAGRSAVTADTTTKLGYASRSAYPTGYGGAYSTTGYSGVGYGGYGYPSAGYYTSGLDYGSRIASPYTAGASFIPAYPTLGDAYSYTSGGVYSPYSTLGYSSSTVTYPLSDTRAAAGYTTLGARSDYSPYTTLGVQQRSVTADPTAYTSGMGGLVL